MSHETIKSSSSTGIASATASGIFGNPSDSPTNKSSALIIIGDDAIGGAEGATIGDDGIGGADGIGISVSLACGSRIWIAEKFRGLRGGLLLKHSWQARKELIVPSVHVLQSSRPQYRQWWRRSNILNAVGRPVQLLSQIE